MAYVEIYIDEELLGSDLDLPFEFIWNSTPVSNGYHYLMAKAYDTAGNSGTDTVFINVQNGDLEPPTAPTDLATTAVSSNQVDLNWTASIDNLGVVGYDVFRNGVQISTTEITSFSDTGLIASTTYTYFVVAKDAAGNQSTASNAFEVTTLEAPLYGSLAGTVYSTSGGVISNVRVSITVQKTLITGFTDLAGQYMIMGLPPGTYSVKYIPPTGDHLQSTVQLNIQAGFTTVQNVTLKKKNSRS